MCLTCESALGYLGKFIKSAVKHSWAQVFCTEDAACTVRRPAGAKRGSLFTSRSCISAHGGKPEAFHLIQPGMFSETIKSPNICSRLCHQLSASRLLDKTFHRRLLVFVFCSFDLNPPSFPFQHNPPFTPAGLFVYRCDKRGKLIRRWQSSPRSSKQPQPSAVASGAGEAESFHLEEVSAAALEGQQASWSVVPKAASLNISSVFQLPA